MIRLHIPSIVSLARQIFTIPARRVDDLIDRALVDADGLVAPLPPEAFMPDFEALADALGVTPEPTPIYNDLIAGRATDRARMFGDCDFDEWARELHPSNWDGDAA